MFTFFINICEIIKLLTGEVFPENTTGKILHEKKKTVAVTESCTGGLISSLLTDVSGSSDYILANFTTYSNEAKMKYLGVQKETLDNFGAVSEQTAKEMAEGLLKATGCDFAIATTGIAGPTGGSSEKPVGLMYIGISDGNNTKVLKINKSPKLYRRIMKISFAKEAVKQLNTFIRQEK